MTVKQVRKLFGKDAIGKSDEDIEHIIETAEMLKNLFFECIKHKDIEKTKMTS